jgi:hypothetical protein
MIELNRYKLELLMKVKPLGVTVVAALTLMSAFAFFFLQMLLIGLNAVGGPPPSGTSYTMPWSFFAPLFLAACALAVSIGQFLGARWAWYASMAFWIVLLSISAWFLYAADFANGTIWFDHQVSWSFTNGFEGFLAVLTIFIIYGIGCLAYFSSKKPREYFRI